MHTYSLDDFWDINTREGLITTLCQSDSINVSILYTSDFRSAKILREVVDSICKWYGVNPKWRTRLVLIIDELNNNAIEYGSKKWEANIFNLILDSKSKEGLYIEASVTDTGNGPHAKKAWDMEELRNKHAEKDFTKHTSIRGRGLFLIITQLVDKLYFKDDKDKGLIVWVQKHLPAVAE